MMRAILIGGAAALSVCAGSAAMAEEAAESANAPPSTLSAPKIEYTRWVLENGLEVIALPDNSTANVTTSLWYKVGSKHDPEGRAGFSHLFEHISSRKTVNMPLNMVNRLTEDVGGQRNASNWIDRTNYYETVPAQYLETMLWTHRERMAFLVVDEEVFEKERSVVKEELRQRVLAPPYGRLQRFVIPENAFDVLPMRRPGIGSIEELDDATLEDARAFHQAFYGPDTATLIVAGNFEVPRLKELADTYFADIPRRANPVSLDIPLEEPRRTQPRSVSAAAPNVPLPLIGDLWKGPSVTHPDAAALEVLSTVLSGGESSRLNDALVRSGKAVNAAHFDSLTMDGGYIASYAVLSPTGKAEEARAILDEQIERVRREPVTQVELTEAKNQIFSAALSQRQTVRGRAFELGEALMSTGNPDAADIRLERIAAVTPQDILRVAQTWLDPRSKVSMEYTRGEYDPETFANPYPRPDYGSVAPPTGEPRKVLPEAERMVPPPAGEIPEVVRADFVETQLSNGIPLVSTQTSEIPIATITLVMPGGDATDPLAKAGLATMAADLADNGTTTRSATQIAATLEALGASVGISSARDGVYASVTAPTANLAEAGAVLVDIIQNSNYPAEEVERERKRTLDGFSATLKDPGALASLVATRVLYGDAPYGRVGNLTSMAAISREDLLVHRETWWHPGRAKLVISGGISSNEAANLAENLFGDWTSDAPAPQAVGKPAGEPLPPRTLVIDMPEAGQAAVVAGVRATSRSDEDFYRLWLANTVLGSGSNGRLFDEVRTKRGLSYGAYSSLGQSLDAALLTARSQTKNETADEVAALFLEQFERLGDEPLYEETLQKRRLYLSGAIARSLETTGGFNGQVANLMLRGIEPSEAFAISERLSQVTADEAAEMARKYLSTDRASLVIVGDAEQFLDELKDLRGEVEVIPATQLDLGTDDLRKADG
ncbi:MAG: pitrilysin family protein [Erythrobacter sp.]|uniref:M16 family metallopeptidase n=1 Tax=Erythrobacter sp. TaxID=1042 RepID=UPI00262BFEBB|nr:pitrilysin family protein [Erythrobacter sp.]MDJ0978979.1 pitrilysin family protein [Erythrobacter sp.]